MRAHIKHTLFETVMLFSIAFVILCACIQESKADSIHLGAWSYHINPVVGVNNERHDLIAYEHNSYVIAVFKNSFGDRTYGVGKEFELFEYNNIKGSVLVGLDYGYKECIAKKQTAEQYKYHSRGDAQVCFLAVPSIQYTKYKLQPTISLMGDAVTLGTKWDF